MADDGDIFLVADRQIDAIEDDKLAAIGFGVGFAQIFDLQEFLVRQRL
jgi:hypothetical protein